MPKKLLSTMAQVTGLPHHDAPDLLSSLQAGTSELSDSKYATYLPVVFVPEPENAVDRNAIRVEVPAAVMADGKPRKLGYIPAKANNHWHSFFFDPGFAPRKPQVSAKIRIDDPGLSSGKGSMWEIQVHSPDPDLPRPILIAAPSHHNFQFQKDIWNALTIKRPKRRKGEIQVWI